ncbi:MAG TPA: hypothetical protein ENK32_02215 [Anaerolineae bacterium]|nr:hypothetical protein [Anaerolineae bacterium]
MTNKTKAAPDADGCYAALTAVSLPPDQITAVTINGRKLILVRREEQIVAFNAACPHAAADLSQGQLSRHKITCADHDKCWDIRNGRILYPEDENYRLTLYDVKVSDGIIKVKLP